MNAETMTEEALAVVLRVENTDSAFAWYQRLGFNMEYEHSRGPAFELHDPDGNRIRVVTAPNIIPRPGRLIAPS
jgi:hypothetical protein